MGMPCRPQGCWVHRALHMRDEEAPRHSHGPRRAQHRASPRTPGILFDDLESVFDIVSFHLFFPYACKFLLMEKRHCLALPRQDVFPSLSEPQRLGCTTETAAQPFFARRVQ